MTTRGGALAAGRARLAAAGLESAALEARILLCHVLGCGPEALVGWPERAVASEQVAAFEALVARRARREPVAHLVGRREFWGLEFRVSPATLVPRPDSETLVEAALDGIADRGAPLRILDVGTGTGCLLIALLRELPAARGVGVDVAPAALALARDNAVALSVASRVRWSPDLPAAGDRFDLVVANLPYVARADLASLEPDVRDWEPASALDGGPDGLDVFRAVLPALPPLLAPRGRVLLEVGRGQAEDVEHVGAAAGLVARGRRRDLAGIERVVELGRRAD
jgi:release factor glutamine methyltransferase